MILIMLIAIPEMGFSLVMLVINQLGQIMGLVNLIRTFFRLLQKKPYMMIVASLMGNLK